MFGETKWLSVDWRSRNLLLSDLRVLVVEDSPVHALLMERILAKKGISSVVRAKTGEDAIRFIKLVQEDIAVKPDRVLLDLNLPGISSKEVLETIKSNATTRSIPVVVIMPRTTWKG